MSFEDDEYRAKLRADIRAAIEQLPSEEPDEAPALPEEQPFDPAPHREAVRRNTTYGLLLLIALLCIALYVPWVLGRPTDDTMRFHSAVVGPLMTLAGTILGFYFGAESRR
jgi:type VI protein secretion system component VasF